MKNDINQSVIVIESNGRRLLTCIPASEVEIGEKRTINYCFRRVDVTVHSIVDYKHGAEIVRNYNMNRVNA